MCQGRLIPNCLCEYSMVNLGFYDCRFVLRLILHTKIVGTYDWLQVHGSSNGMLKSECGASGHRRTN